MTERKSGILLHITSLPGKEGIGTLGQEAFAFVDFLKETGQKIWQILPLGPVGYGNSPYQCYSAFAGNPLLIDLEALIQANSLTKEDLGIVPRRPKKRVDFDRVGKWKYPLLRKAFSRFKNVVFNDFQEDYNRFLDVHSWWLNDYAFFMAAKKHFKNQVWTNWSKDVKFRKTDCIEKLRTDLSEEIDFHKYLQFIFFRQWHQLKEYANSKGVEIVGDVPLYVSTDSSDVWANTDIFILDNELNPTEVGGVPPDYFSETGQLWGNPVFNWSRLKERDYDWWIARMHFNLMMFDHVRIDHFRGLESYWSIPAEEETAINGEWIPAHGHNLLAKLNGQLGELLFIAEDLGIITPEVDQLREAFNLPGMKVLQFAFTTDASNKDLPHNYSENFVVYTGTHDNDTTLGWLLNARGEEKELVENYIGEAGKDALRKVVEMAMASVAKMAIFPMQDVLELDSEARMNTPGTASGNWHWRFHWKEIKQSQKKFLNGLTLKYNR